MEDTSPDTHSMEPILPPQNHNDLSNTISQNEVPQKRTADEEDPKSTKKPKLSIDDPKPTKNPKSNPSLDFDTQRKINRLEQKISSGKINENYVSINVNRKRYVRGKKTTSFSKYKKQQWKMKKKLAASRDDSSSGGVLKCFKCGDVGHFSKQCRKSKPQFPLVEGFSRREFNRINFGNFLAENSVLLPLEEYDDAEESPFPTLEEAAEMVERMNKKKLETDEAEDVIMFQIGQILVFGEILEDGENSENFT